MVRLWLGFLALAAWAQGAESMRIRGATLVDPSTRSERQSDVFMQDGRVVEGSGLDGPVQELDGRGLFLMPALWDLQASLWGNDSAKDYHELDQSMSISQCLKIQLYYGVAHVSAALMSKKWVGREMNRADALEIPAAELLFPDKVLAGAGAKDWAAIQVTRVAQVGPLLDELKAQSPPFLYVSCLAPNDGYLAGLSPGLAHLLIRQAGARSLKTYVLVDTWDKALRVVQDGATAIAGLPHGRVPETLLALMRAHHCAYAPRLTQFLECNRLQDSEAAREDPFLADSVPAEVRDSFRDPKALWKEWKAASDFGRANQDQSLRNLREIAAAGIHILSATESGSTAGTFHGFSTHANQAWMERAGLDPWVRLSAATLWPAEFLGRLCNFAPGAPADFVALSADPLQGAGALRRIVFIVRKGRKVGRNSLVPDLTRHRFRPYR
jgi:hypothetical protein